jgi:hypothetical protein
MMRKIWSCIKAVFSAINEHAGREAERMSWRATHCQKCGQAKPVRPYGGPTGKR